MKSPSVSVSKAANLLGVSESQVRKWYESRMLNGDRMRAGGVRLRLTHADIVSFGREHPELVAPPKGKPIPPQSDNPAPTK